MSRSICGSKKYLKLYQQTRNFAHSTLKNNFSCLSNSLKPAVVLHVSVRHNTQHRVYLLPEYPAETYAKNVSLKSYKSGLPDFEKMTEATCYYGLGQRLIEFESAVCRVEDEIDNGNTDWSKVLTGIETAKLELESMFCCVALMEIATDKLDMDRFKQLTRRAERALLSKYDSRSIHGLISGDQVTPNEPEEKAMLHKYQLEYKHAGYELAEKKYLELTTQWLKRLSEAQRDARFKLTTATQRFRHVIRDPAIVREFPVDLLRAMSADSSQPAKGPWSVSLHPYIYRKFMSYCPDRRLRWSTYNAQVSRGSMNADYYLNCAGHVKDIRQHRLDQAITIGYQNYAEMSLASKMAANVDNVKMMLSSLANVAKESQEQEVAALQEYAETRGFTDKIREFDVAFFRRKQVRTLFGLDEEAMRDYFPLPVVLDGIFNLIKFHFNLEFRQVTPVVGNVELGSVWHPDCSLFTVTDADDNRLLGHCYLDPYIRDDKAYQGGDKGWFIPLRQHSKVADCNAAGALIMALSNPGYGKPSLLSFQEVEELVKQFGKVTQHFLNRGQYSDNSCRLVEYDCLNVVPELLVSWLSVPHVLQSMSRHWSSGEQLAAAQLNSLIEARCHMAGYDLCQELYKAAYDMAFYSEDYEAEQYTDLADRLAEQYLVIPREKEDAFPLYFEEMMTGHHAAGYYCHVWSKMLAADIFSAYKEVGLENSGDVKKLSGKFKDIWLQSSGSIHTADLFRNFRGRDPSPEALLISLGLQKIKQPKSRSQSH